MLYRKFLPCEYCAQRSLLSGCLCGLLCFVKSLHGFPLQVSNSFQGKLDSLRLRPPLVSDYLSLGTSFPKYQKFQFKVRLLFYKITELLRAISLVDKCVQMRVCKHGRDDLDSRVFLKLFYKRNRALFPFLRNLI